MVGKEVVYGNGRVVYEDAEAKKWSKTLIRNYCEINIKINKMVADCELQRMIFIFVICVAFLLANLRLYS